MHCNPNRARLTRRAVCLSDPIPTFSPPRGITVPLVACIRQHNEDNRMSKRQRPPTPYPSDSEASKQAKLALERYEEHQRSLRTEVEREGFIVQQIRNEFLNILRRTISLLVQLSAEIELQDARTAMLMKRRLDLAEAERHRRSSARLRTAPDSVGKISANQKKSCH